MEEKSELFEHHKIVADGKQAICRLDLFLVNKLKNVSRTRIQAGIRQESILVNGKKQKPSYLIKPHDLIQVLLPNPPSLDHLVPQEIPLDIIYEDKYLLLVNKVAKMVVHPGIGNPDGTLVNALCYYFEQLPTLAGDVPRPGLAHRIDKGTSGLLVIGKTEEALAGLARQFAHHTIQRQYLALVWGDVAQDKGTIDLPLARSRADRRIMEVCAEGFLGGKASVTHYEVLERFGLATLIACRLETGRTHQIRAHLKHLGHPLFGDTRYGGDKVVKGQLFSKYKAFVKNCFTILPYQALHAKSLGFFHPILKKDLFFEVPLPLAFATILKKWRRYVG